MQQYRKRTFGLFLIGTAGLLALFVVPASMPVLVAALVAFAGGLAWLMAAHDRALDELRAAQATRAPARRESAPLRAKIAEGIDDPLLLLDPDKKVLDANRAARELFGERLAGRDLALGLRHPDVLEAVAEIQAGGTTRRLEISLTGPVERSFTVSVARVSNRRQPGEESDEPDYHIVLSMHDITQMKQAERMRADFVANASHELRTPLSSLIGFIETLRGPAKSDTAAAGHFLAIMNEEALRMARLIDDLLSLSRIELDKHVQPDSRAEIGGILEGVAKSLEPVAGARDMTIRVSVPPDLPPVRGDRDQIFQLVHNLVANALKYAGAGSVVEVSTAAGARIPETGHEGVVLRVDDKGPGIAPEHLPRLTERFYRVDAARSRQMGGTGLGLAIVKHIVNRHRGHLDIRSTPGVGTSVTVTLPVFRAPVVGGKS